MSKTPPPAVPDAGEPAVYAPLSGRRRWLVGALGVATALGVIGLMTRPVTPVPPHLVPPPRQPAAAPEPARCAPGQSQGCVGGSAAVFAVPATAPAAASGR